MITSPTACTWHLRLYKLHNELLPLPDVDQTRVEVEAWLDGGGARSSRVFVLEGGPGIGKSAIAAQLVTQAHQPAQELSRERRLPRRLVDHVHE